MELQLATRHEGDVSVVSARGEVDVFSAPDLDTELDALIAAGAVRLVVDLSDVAFLDSTGLGVLVKALKHTREGGGWLRLVVTSDRIRKIFEITGLDASIPIFDTAQDAILG
ncbi:MAG TPA: STAS domain-containing protein [Motilibacterales bacterium]|nr:STAS domain-containing protein [Motilibacterales bacterium]